MLSHPLASILFESPPLSGNALFSNKLDLGRAIWSLCPNDFSSAKSASAFIGQVISGKRPSTERLQQGILAAVRAKVQDETQFEDIRCHLVAAFAALRERHPAGRPNRHVDMIRISKQFDGLIFFLPDSEAFWREWSRHPIRTLFVLRLGLCLDAKAESSFSDMVLVASRTAADRFICGLFDAATGLTVPHPTQCPLEPTEAVQRLVHLVSSCRLRVQLSSAATCPLPLLCLTNEGVIKRAVIYYAEDTIPVKPRYLPTMDQLDNHPALTADAVQASLQSLTSHPSSLVLEEQP